MLLIVIIIIPGCADMNKVEVRLDQADGHDASGTDSWTYDWNSTQCVFGGHTITARATDGSVYSPEASVSIVMLPPVPRGWLAGTVKTNYRDCSLEKAIIGIAGRSETGTTNSTGHYNISLPAGKYVAIYSAAGHYSQYVWSETIAVNRTTVTDVTLQAHTGSVAGRVVDGDTWEGIPYATVSSPQLLLLTRTNESGYFQFRNVLVGLHDFSASAEGYGNATQSVPVKKDQIADAGFTLAFRSWLKGTVTDNNTGKLLGGVLLRLEKYSVLSEPNGSFYMEVKSGSYALETYLAGYDNTSRRVHIARGENSIEIHLDIKMVVHTGFNWRLVINLVAILIVLLVIIAIPIFLAGKDATGGIKRPRPGAMRRDGKSARANRIIDNQI